METLDYCAKCWTLVQRSDASSVPDRTSSKRATPPRASDYTKTFLKGWERLSRSGRYDLKRLKEAMLHLIANDAPLGPEWLDHPPKGDWADHRECPTSVAVSC
ncbi:type II toxin-antitoxin system mRNA interferase toxin, RelE/StbE family [Ralstonia pseudosolanacearum]